MVPPMAIIWTWRALRDRRRRSSFTASRCVLSPDADECSPWYGTFSGSLLVAMLLRRVKTVSREDQHRVLGGRQWAFPWPRSRWYRFNRLPTFGRRRRLWACEHNHTAARNFSGCALVGRLRGFRPHSGLMVAWLGWASHLHEAESVERPLPNGLLNLVALVATFSLR